MYEPANSSRVYSTMNRPAKGSISSYSCLARWTSLISWASSARVAIPTPHVKSLGMSWKSAAAMISNSAWAASISPQSASANANAERQAMWTLRSPATTSRSASTISALRPCSR